MIWYYYVLLVLLNIWGVPTLCLDQGICKQCDSFEVPPGEGTRCSLRMRYEGPDGQKGEPSTEAIFD